MLESSVLRDEEVTRLFDQDKLHRRIDAGELPAWAVEHYETFRASMLTEHNETPFPCHFGVESERQGWALYTFVPSMTDSDALERLCDVLLAYLRTFDAFENRTSLVTFFKRPDETLSTEAWHARYWNVLQFLHEHDPEPWPEAFPSDPDEPQFEFCFGGHAIFPTGRAPCYDARHSRYNPHGLEITVQPRAVFDGLTGDTPAGKHARSLIQGWLETYDEVGVHPDLGDWEDDHSHEWKQYLLPDDQRRQSDCPLEIQA